MRAVCFGARDMDRGGKVISGCKSIHGDNRGEHEKNNDNLNEEAFFGTLLGFFFLSSS